MKKPRSEENKFDELRKRAENFLSAPANSPQEALPDNVRHLVEELHVYQIELEMQNEHLRQTQLELETARDRYSDLYDFAPTGYFVLSDKGMILEANLTGASMLGVERELLIGNSFSKFINRDDQDIFYHHRRKLIEKKGEETFELRLVKKDKSEFHVQMECISLFVENGGLEKVRVAVTDITERKRMEEDLRKSHGVLEKRVAERTAQLRKLSGKILEVQEYERKRIGLELHDSVGQSLAAIKFIAENVLSQIRQGGTEDFFALLESLIPVIQQAVDEVRRIHAELRPSLLDDLGIITTISWFCREFGVHYSGIQIKTAIDIEETDVFESLKIVIFRILQEALNNVAKHSKAETVCVSLQKKNDQIELIVQDNGRGFDVRQKRLGNRMTGGFGLSNMKERTELAGGAFTIQSDNGTGTTVRALWPAMQIGQL